MKLTEKDKLFLEKLRRMVAKGELSVEFKSGLTSRDGVPITPGCMVLKGTYGQRVHRVFGMTRQGVRWRFWRLFNDIYVSAFETIVFIEQAFGPHLRDPAVRISQQRHELRRHARTATFQGGDAVAHATQAAREAPDADHHSRGVDRDA